MRDAPLAQDHLQDAVSFERLGFTRKLLAGSARFALLPRLRLEGGVHVHGSLLRFAGNASRLLP
ncbi:MULTISPECIES: hypothetical protein [unclassified Pseudomonas]|uniref:hypothetical protein n=1 Tax=unclassified Pseudomonas TaxID=196821 RepID=UPI000EE4BE6E|nr:MULTISPECIES: hypothetical protein [unclassified Pseudomonas]HBZ93560.1 hypothetical protein [Pseudomonas sp.]